MKTILVFAHKYNTFDKRALLKTIDTNSTITETKLLPKNFIKDKKLIKFYIKQ